MIVLAIWLFLAGYTIAITGKRNLGLSYQPQPDGSIKAQDGQGNQARAFSLMDVISCQDASVSVKGQPAPLGAAQSSRASTPSVQPNLSPNPIGQLGPLPLPQPIQIPLPRPLPRPPALPNPGGILGGLLDFERNVERDVYGGLSGAAEDVRQVLSRVRVPRIRVPLSPLP